MRREITAPTSRRKCTTSASAAPISGSCKQWIRYRAEAEVIRDVCLKQSFESSEKHGEGIASRSAGGIFWSTAAARSDAGLLLSGSSAGGGSANAGGVAGPPANTQVNTWLNISSNGVVTLTIGSSEMGQGSFSGLAQILSEDLMVNYNTIQTVQGVPATGAAGDRQFHRDVRQHRDSYQLLGLCARLARPRARCWCRRR